MGAFSQTGGVLIGGGAVTREDVQIRGLARVVRNAPYTVMVSRDCSSQTKARYNVRYTD
ncbi:hypothetical protein NBRC116598_04430 [Pseudophaeobacter arcticus]|uniref:Uncharacterized protein n=1 Tax=Pseudophaeobacter arcticus TaxID=385492 RepID=A0ABQ0AGK2_9RHOB